MTLHLNANHRSDIVSNGTFASTGVPAVVRSMPNTPAMVGEGMTMWVQTPAVTPKQHEQAKKLLRCFGHEIFAEDEHYLDMVCGLGQKPHVALVLTRQANT